MHAMGWEAARDAVVWEAVRRPAREAPCCMLLEACCAGASSGIMHGSAGLVRA